MASIAHSACLLGCEVQFQTHLEDLVSECPFQHNLKTEEETETITV